MVNQEFKVLVTGLPRNFLVEPGILGKNQEVSQEVPGEVGTSCLTFPTMTSVTAIYFKCFQQVSQEVQIYQELLPGSTRKFQGEPVNKALNSWLTKNFEKFLKPGT